MKTLHAFRSILIGTIFSFNALTGSSQNVAINTTGASADPSAMLDVKSTTAGVLIPRMSTTQRNAISSPAIGLQIFNTDCDMLNYWTGTCWVSAGAIPAPDSISSNSSTALCAGATATYSIPAVTGATAYYWSAPSAANITSGQGSTSINVTFGSYSGNVCVTANDACETSQTTCRQITVITPAAPGAISGVTSFCAGAAGIAYSIPSVAGATSYTWSVPSGATVTAGQGTNAITVNFGSASGNISVYATSSCGNSSTQTLPVTLIASVPSTPGPITGNYYICASTNQSYSISPVTGALSYTWQVPSGVTILSGQGTNSITINYPSSGGSGNITVSATNACGTSALSLLAVSVASLAPLAPGSITGPTSVSTSSSATYSIASIKGGNGGASGYKWTISPAATISAGQGTIQITVAFGSAAQSYSLCVYDSNGCGKSIPSCLTVTTSTVCPLHGSASFIYTGSLQNWSVPCGITSVTAYMWGAGGGPMAGSYYAAGGTGAFVAAALNVTGISILNVIVGQGAAYGTSYPNGTYGGGGNNAANSSTGAGGGRSAIQFNGSGTDVLTSGGGGGAGGGYSTNYRGNGGGGGNGTAQSNGTGSGTCTTNYGFGGTATAPGGGGAVCSGTSTSYNGNPGTLYQGGGMTTYANPNIGYYGGAGGGGYYGGGSGASDYGGGGGGGASYPTGTNSIVTTIITEVAGNYNSGLTSTQYIYPPDYVTSPYSGYYVSGVGTTGTGNYGSTSSGGNGEVVIIY